MIDNILQDIMKASLGVIFILVIIIGLCYYAHYKNYYVAQPTITIQQINTKLTIEDILKKYDGKSLTIIITKETI